MNFETQQNSQSLLQTVLGSLREGILVIDHTQRVILYNRPAMELFRLPSVPPGEDQLRLIDVTRNKVVHQGFQKVLAEGGTFDSELHFLNSEDRTYDFRVTPLIVSPDHTVTGAIGVFFDITQLLRLERIRREFFSNLSHELRTPLTSILVYVETLLNGALYDSENNLQFLKIIDKHATRMQNLVQDISDLSAIEGNEVTFSPTSIDLKTFVDNLTTLVEQEVEKHLVTFTNAIGPEIFVYADFKSLEQILMNLIINGIKFNRPGGSVTVDAFVDGDKHVVVKVQDTGIGIEAHHLSRIFERLYRVDKSRSQEAGGTGLGLAIVKHLVLAQHGEISVESTPTVGSEFRVRLPRPPQPDQ